MEEINSKIDVLSSKYKDLLQFQEMPSQMLIYKVLGKKTKIFQLLQQGKIAMLQQNKKISLL